MATIVIGDIHGNSAALDDLLRQLKSVVSPGDVVVFLGDYIDRGPDAKECVDRIPTLQHEMPGGVVCLCGNQEDWFLHTLRDSRRHTWLLAADAFTTIRSYSVDAAHVLGGWRDCGYWATLSKPRFDNRLHAPRSPGSPQYQTVTTPRDWSAECEMLIRRSRSTCFANSAASANSSSHVVSVPRKVLYFTISVVSLIGGSSGKSRRRSSRPVCLDMVALPESSSV